MKFAIILFVLICFTAFGDTVWYYPFTELGADWEFSVWDSTATGLSYTGDIYGGYIDGVTASSGDLTLPAGVDSFTVEMWSGYDHDGIVMDAGIDTELKATVYTPNAHYTIFWETMSNSGWDRSSFYESDTTFVSETIQPDGDNTISLEFFTEMTGWGWLYEADLYWGLWDVTITGHEDTELSRSTWAGIKSCLQ